MSDRDLPSERTMIAVIVGAPTLAVIGIALQEWVRIAAAVILGLLLLLGLVLGALWVGSLRGRRGLEDEEPLAIEVETDDDGRPRVLQLGDERVELVSLMPETGSAGGRRWHAAAADGGWWVVTDAPAGWTARPADVPREDP